MIITMLTLLGCAIIMDVYLRGKHIAHQMGEVGLVEAGSQGCAIAGDGEGDGGEGIADEVADGEVHVERQVGPNEGKAAGYNRFQAMLVELHR
jgi:hypothetical protein